MRKRDTELEKGYGKFVHTLDVDTIQTAKITSTFLRRLPPHSLSNVISYCPAFCKMQCPVLQTATVCSQRTHSVIMPSRRQVSSASSMASETEG